MTKHLATAVHGRGPAPLLAPCPVGGRADLDQALADPSRTAIGADHRGTGAAPCGDGAHAFHGGPGLPMRPLARHGVPDGSPGTVRTAIPSLRREMD